MKPMSPENKELIIALVVVFASLLFWLSLSAALTLPVWNLSPIVWSGILAFFLFMAALALAIILIERSWIFVIAWAISSFAVFLWYQDFSLLIAAVFLFLSGVAGYFRAHGEIKHVIGARLARPLRKAIPLISTFLAILVAAASYVAAPYTSPDLQRILPENIFSTLVGWSEPVISKVLPGFQKDISIGDYIVNLSAADLKKTPESLTTAEHQMLVEQGVENIRQRAGVNIQSGDSLTHILYQIGMHEIENRSSAYSRLFPIIFAVGFFMLLRLIAWPIDWLAIGSAFFALQLLLRLKVVELRTITVELGAYSLI